jgi:uncharacterized membrane protein
MKRVGALLLRGLAIVLPIGLTLYAVYWLAIILENVAGAPLRWILGDLYLPGLGLVLGVTVIAVVGLLTFWSPFRLVLRCISALLERVPLVKSLYGGLQDLTDFITRSHNHSQLSHVVMCSPIEGIQLLGFITREDFSRLPDMTRNDEAVAVYLPMSYQIGGFTVFVPRRRIRQIDMSVEDAMRFAMTAGMSVKQDPLPDGRSDPEQNDGIWAELTGTESDSSTDATHPPDDTGRAGQKPACQGEAIPSSGSVREPVEKPAGGPAGR